ncbi:MULTISPECIES: hypothetical protein [Raoultella]|uniref:hypothetical protein n=1 Tax=Raoultella TaxID=160674 RepID=UPI0021694BE0|nr:MULTISPECIES: hypothetical protein [Raoultella]MCS4270923.1 hypothetical protein [Raoultella sp. BIGb0132]MCS4288769.1 hypothetical protein [Raoultella terrigena]
MGQVEVFNASKSDIYVSLNNGSFFTVNAATQVSWQAGQAASPPTFVNNTTAATGQLKLGDNIITAYSSTSGPATAGICTITIPENIPINSIQLYLFWKDATSVAAIVLQDGQPFQAVIITRATTSMLLNAVSAIQYPLENNKMPLPPHPAGSKIKINL